jgi:hypothetical protein
MRIARILDLIDSVEPQAVEAILLDPVEDVVEKPIRSPQGVGLSAWKKSGAI